MLPKVYDFNICPICNNETNYYSATFYKCTVCGHMIDSVTPDFEYMTSDTYIQLYKDAEQRETENKKHKERWRLVEKYASGAKTLLDYGCTIGTFLNLCPNGMKLTGFDTSWKTGYCDERVLDESYDVLCIFHTLEHVKDPVHLLNRIKHKWLFLCLPWIEYLHDDDLASWRYVAHGMHIQFFTKDSLFRLLSDYKILEVNFKDGELENPKHPKWFVSLAAVKKQ